VESFGKAFNMAISLLEILRIRGLLPFSGVTLTVAFSKSISVHLSLLASPLLIPVSFSNCRYVANLFVFEHPAMKSSISLSVDMKGIFSTLLYLGGSHLPPRNTRKLV